MQKVGNSVADLLQCLGLVRTQKADCAQKVGVMESNLLQSRKKSPA